MTERGGFFLLVLNRCEFLTEGYQLINSSVSRIHCSEEVATSYLRCESIARCSIPQAIPRKEIRSVCGLRDEVVVGSRPRVRISSFFSATVMAETPVAPYMHYVWRMNTFCNHRKRTATGSFVPIPQSDIRISADFAQTAEASHSGCGR